MPESSTALLIGSGGTIRGKIRVKIKRKIEKVVNILKQRKNMNTFHFMLDYFVLDITSICPYAYISSYPWSCLLIKKFCYRSIWQMTTFLQQDAKL